SSARSASPYVCWRTLLFGLRQQASHLELPILVNPSQGESRPLQRASADGVAEAVYRSEWPKSRSGAMRSRTNCFSSLISGKRPCAERDQTLSASTRTSN